MPWTPEDDEPPVYATGWWAEFALSSVGGIASAEAFGTATVASFQGIWPSGIPSAESVSAPALLYRQFVAPTGIGSLEAFGGSALDPGDIGVLPQGIASQESVGEPNLSVSTVSVAPAGISSEEVFGSVSVVRGAVDIAPGGIASGEAFGSSSVVNIVEPSGIISQEAFGAVQVNLGLFVSGTMTSEAFGTPNVVGPPQAIVPASIESLEAFGGSDLDPGAVQILPQGIGSAESVGAPGVSVGSVNIAPNGIASGEAFGGSKLVYVVQASGIPSAESVGAAQVNHGLSMSGIASAEAFGTAEFVVGSVALTPVGYNTVIGSSIALPAHLPGDLIIVVAAQPGVSAAPILPSAGGTVPAWSTVDSTAAAGGMRSAQFVATANNHTSGTWTGANVMAAIVLRGQRLSSPVGGHAITATASATFTAPSVTLAHSDGSSVLLHVFTTNNLSSWPSAPAGYTAQSSKGSSGGNGILVLTKNATTSDGSVGVAAGTVFSFWQATSIEIAAY